MRLFSRLILTLIPRAVLAEALDRAETDGFAEIQRRAEALTFRIGAVERRVGQLQRALFRRQAARVDDATFADGALGGARPACAEQFWPGCWAASPEVSQTDHSLSS